MATRSEAAPRSRASRTRAFPRLRARAYAGSSRISSRLTFSARMNADDSRRNGYLARVASSTSEGTPRSHKRPTRGPAKRGPRIRTGTRFARAFPLAPVQKTEERAADGHRSDETMPANKTPRHVPPGFNPVTLYLTVDDPDRLAAFAEAAFGAGEREDPRPTGPHGKKKHPPVRVPTWLLW